MSMQTALMDLNAQQDDALFYRNLIRHYPQVERGEGIRLYDGEGRCWLDACGGAMVTAIGHGHRHIGEAYAEQCGRVAFAHSLSFTNAPARALAQRLAASAPGDLNHVYFVSSGSEATETAMKLAFAYHRERGEPGRRKIIGRWGSYHGATWGALSMGGLMGAHVVYQPELGRFPHIPGVQKRTAPPGVPYEASGAHFADQLEQAIMAEGPETVAAFIAEPIVAGGLGCAVPPHDYWPRVREICERHGVLLIADEVITGMGRTGRRWACEHWSVVPDLLVAAKGLTSGYAPLAAVLMRDHVQEAFARGSGRFDHGHTWSMHAPTCAVGLAVLDHLEGEGLFERVAPLGAYARERLETLRELPAVWDVRGMGLLFGVEFAQDADGTPFPPGFGFYRRLEAAAFERGLLVYPGHGTVDGDAGDHVLVAPHYITTEAEIDEIVALLGETIAAVGREYHAG